jgi:hypothetical protein
MKKLIIFVLALLAFSQSAIAAQYFLKQTLLEGESRDYTVGGYVYHIELAAVFDTQLKAQFIINGEKTDAMSKYDEQRLSDGAMIQLKDVLPQESGDGKDLVQFNFFPAEHNGSNKAAATSTAPAKTPNVTTAPAKTVPTEQKAAAETQPAAQPQKIQATVDMTKKMPEKSWWKRILEWFSGIFK